MRYELSQVLPWGRSFELYVGTFDLKEKNLEMRILGCADGRGGNEMLRIIDGHQRA